MSWLKDHVYVAGWLSPIIAIIIALLKSNWSAAKLDTTQFTLTFLVLASFAAIITPETDSNVRFTCYMIFSFCLAALLVSSRRS